MNAPMRYTDIGDMPPELQDSCMDELDDALLDLEIEVWLLKRAEEMEAATPAVILGQGDYRMEYTPEPLSMRVGRPVVAFLCVVGGLAMFGAILFALERWLA